MTSIVERLCTTWPATYELQPKTSEERKNVIEIQTLKADARDEIESLRARAKELEAELHALKQQAGEPVARIDEIWLAYSPKVDQT